MTKLIHERLAPTIPYYTAAFPIFWGFSVMLGLGSAYLNALEHKHVANPFPYVSECGVHPPESYIFSGIMSWAAVGAYVLFKAKFEYDVKYYEKYLLPWICSCTLHVLGVIVVVSLILAGVYPCCSHWGVEDPDEYKIKERGNTIHFYAAYTLCCSGIICLCSISASDLYWYHQRHHIRSKCLTAIRWILALSAVACGMFVAIFMEKAEAFKVGDMEHFNEMMWNSSLPGYSDHTNATRSEWGLIFCFLAFIMTFSYEVFKNEKHFQETYHGPIITEERCGSDSASERPHQTELDRKFPKTQVRQRPTGISISISGGTGNV